MTLSSSISPFAPPPRHVPLIALRGVSAGPALDDVTLALPEGGQTAIVGPCATGAGTLFALLQRRLEPAAGTIRLDGRDLTTIPHDELARTVAAVERDAPVLAGTLRDNLHGAVPGASGGELAAVVAEARLEGLLERLPEGLDSELATRGARLGGGERQRIAIARALLRRPRILLLDEATARLDARDEIALRATVARAATRCTVLVIAHRLSTVLSADRIVVLDDGRVRACGTHAQLIASDACYRELVATRLGADSA